MDIVDFSQEEGACRGARGMTESEKEKKGALLRREKLAVARVMGAKKKKETGAGKRNTRAFEAS